MTPFHPSKWMYFSHIQFFIILPLFKIITSVFHTLYSSLHYLHPCYPSLFLPTLMLNLLFILYPQQLIQLSGHTSTTTPPFLSSPTSKLPTDHVFWHYSHTFIPLSLSPQLFPMLNVSLLTQNLFLNWSLRFIEFSCSLYLYTRRRSFNWSKILVWMF